jgi:hypothetical protein
MSLYPFPNALFLASCSYAITVLEILTWLSGSLLLVA